MVRLINREYGSDDIGRINGQDNTAESEGFSTSEAGTTETVEEDEYKV
jgi:hypothetical protein